MKKHQIVAAVGTLALAANLLLPNLSFAQQTGSVDVNCPANSGPANNVSLARIPKDITFTSQISPTSALSTFDDSVADATTLPGGNTAAGGIGGTQVDTDHLIGVTDTSSKGVSGCGGDNGWIVTATISSVTDHTWSGGPALGTKGLLGISGMGRNYDDYIPATSMHLVTTTDVETTNIDANPGNAALQVDAGDNVIYNDYTSTGNNHYGIGESPAASNNYRQTSAYLSGSNTLNNAAVPVLTHQCFQGGPGDGENTDIYTGVAVDIDNGIHALQAQGTYQGTIEYTFAQGQACIPN